MVYRVFFLGLKNLVFVVYYNLKNLKPFKKKP